MDLIKKERLLSLDVMRGITIAAMILVNNPGNWSSIYAPLRHAPWHGMTPTDLIYPFFMFIMGVSMSFSLPKYRDGLTGEAFAKILRRSLSIFAVGMALQWFSSLGHGLSSYLLGRSAPETTLWQVLFPLKTFRILGVLQGLALAYFFGSVIVLALRWKHILWVAGGILGTYVVMLHLGNGYELAENNIIAVIDRAVLGAAHLYQDRLPDGARIAFEPEGLLSTLPRIAHVILGVFVGKLISEVKDNKERIRKIFIFGTILLFSGLLLQYGDPLNKKIWSSSFTLASCGFASLFLALMIWIIDIRERRSWCGFFEVFGVNPLFLYVVAWVVSVLLGLNIRFGEKVAGIKGLLYSDVLRPLLADYAASLAHALIFVGIAWIFGYLLYRKKIYIKL